MKKLRFLSVVLGTVFLLGIVQSVMAHPLGNFTVNRYGRFSLTPTHINLFYIVDMAEIPAFQEKQQAIDTNKDGQISPTEQEAYLQNKVPMLIENLHLTVNSKPATWQTASQELAFPAGQGGLETLRLTVQLTAVLPPNTQVWQAEYYDTNYADRLGWQEVVVQAENGISLTGSSAPAQSISDELRTYPEDLLQSPLAVNNAQFGFETAVSATTATNSTVSAVPAANPTNRYSQDEFANLLTTALEQPGAIAAALFVAVTLGAAHALTPGHGKTIVGAYLVGSRGTAKHALFLGLTTTITHTAGVFAFGLLVLFASQFILPEKLFPWLGVLSGLLVVSIGFSLFRERLRQLGYHQPAHEEGFHYHFGVGHTHTPPTNTAVSWRNLLALGVSGGLIPCPSALVLLLSAIALNKVGFGLVLILAFSVGLAGVLTGIGLVLVYANKLFDRMPATNGRITAVVPVLSALFITLAGLGITYQALVQTGIL